MTSEAEPVPLQWRLPDFLDEIKVFAVEYKEKAFSLILLKIKRSLSLII